MHDNDLILTRNLALESASRASQLRSLTTRNVLFGLAAVMGGVGIGLAAIVWAWNQRVDPDALKQALKEMPPIKVETSGQVTMKDGATVGIDP
jgi:hypothetical protein